MEPTKIFIIKGVDYKYIVRKKYNKRSDVMKEMNKQIKMVGENLNETQDNCLKKDSIVNRIKNTCTGVGL